jgi:hydroxypyruvate reductase
MARAAAAALGDRLQSGVVAAPDPADDTIFDHADRTRLQWYVAGHPIPNADSERAGRAALALAAGLGADEELLVLLSGGASALMAVPADGVTLDDKARTTALLLRAGADIHALNCVRKHLSAIKGGALAAAARGGTHTLAISDVVGDDLSVIASGPTVPDATTFKDALGIVGRFGGEREFPAPVVARLQQGAAGGIGESPKPGDPRLARAIARVIASRHDAMRGAAARAQALGYEVVVLDEPVVGEAREAAAALASRQFEAAGGAAARLCIISSGETVVHVKGDGRGGRNQEFALALAAPLQTLERSAAVASVGTDGVDGPTDAAGAIADSTTLARAAAAGADPQDALGRNDAYTFFARLGDLIHTGPTGTNVGDLQFMLFDRI